MNLDDYSRLKNLDGLVRYINDRVPAGGFLHAVLENDLKEAVARADEENMELIPIYVSWLYNEAPTACWGSPEKVAAWLKPKEKDDE